MEGSALARARANYELQAGAKGVLDGIRKVNGGARGLWMLICRGFQLGPTWLMYGLATPDRGWEWHSGIRPESRAAGERKKRHHGQVYRPLRTRTRAEPALWGKRERGHFEEATKVLFWLALAAGAKRRPDWPTPTTWERILRGALPTNECRTLSVDAAFLFQSFASLAALHMPLLLLLRRRQPHAGV